MRPQSAKAKGRRLQQWAAEQYKAVFTHLEGNDVRSLSMGASGDDLILSPAALEVLPYNFEMKNVENFQLWATIRQTERRNETPDLSPCLVVKRNHVDPLAILPFGHFCHLLRFWMCSPRVDGTLPAAPFEPHASAATLLSRFELAPDAERLRTAAAAAAAFALLGPEHVVDGPADGSLVLRDRWVCTLEHSARFNFWKTWDELAARQKSHDKARKRNAALAAQSHALVFNRSDDDATIYIAVPFDAHLDLLVSRWAHVERSKAIALMRKFSLAP